VKNFAEKNYSKLAPIDDNVIIELDKMWHFLRSKKDEFGSGKLITEAQSSSSIGSAAHETRKRLIRKMYERLKKWNIKRLFSDLYSVFVILYHANV